MTACGDATEAVASPRAGTGGAGTGGAGGGAGAGSGTAAGADAGAGVLPAYGDLFCPAEAAAAFEEASSRIEGRGQACELGCVVSLDRSFPLVLTKTGRRRAELAAGIKKREDGIVAVGDWVAVCFPPGHEKTVIAEVMPRRVEIARVKRVGREGQEQRQVLAANVDAVLVCQSLSDGGVDLPLLVRQVAAALGCGACVRVALTKRDLVEDGFAQAELCRVADVFPDIDVVAVTKRAEGDIEHLRSLCAPKTLTLLLGESGVGKSSLANALLGGEVVGVGDVRPRDGKGRHTTVARRMLAVPGGGVLIDAPGLRTLQILDMKRSLDAAFPDVRQAASGCRFRDCTHAGEPGCAVAQEIAPVRLAAYRRLASWG